MIEQKYACIHLSAFSHSVAHFCQPWDSALVLGVVSAAGKNTLKYAGKIIRVREFFYTANKDSVIFVVPSIVYIQYMHTIV